jgi:hypothetical protein
MEAALALGGVFTTTRGAERGRREFCAPYVYAAYPSELPQELQGETLPWVILGNEVPVHARPDARSSVIQRLSYSLVFANGPAVAGGSNGSTWQEVELGKTVGYVDRSMLRSPTDYYVCMAKFGENWLITDITSDRRP